MTVDPGTKMLAVLAQLDGRLRELAHALDSQSDNSPMPLLRSDMTPLQRRMLAQDVHRLRNAMRDVLQQHGLAPPPPCASSLQACRTILHRAFSAVEALAPGHGSDDGLLSDEAQAQVRRSLSRLLLPLEEMERALGPRDLPFETADADIEALSRIAHMHGLSEIQPALSELVRYEAVPDLVVAVLGRANAGKSSLINRLLQHDLLPVDAIPTGVAPVCIRHGVRLRGMAHIARAAPVVLTPGRVAEFASERYNPGNEKLVEHLDFEVPSPLLARGVRLLDSPAWVPGKEPPACDVGLVLIDSAASLALEEVSLVDALRASGSEAIVLLTKADRLGERDRWEVLGHVDNRLWIAPDAQPLAFLVSSTSKNEDLWGDWIARGLEHCIARRGALRESSLRRRKAWLRAAAGRGLERLARAAAKRQEAARQEGMNLIAAARRAQVDLDAEAGRLSARLVREVAHNAAELAWYGRDALLPLAPMIEMGARARAMAAKQDAERELELLAMQCADLLADTEGPVFAWRPQKMDASHFDLGAMPAIQDLPRPFFAGYGTRLLRWYLQWSLHRKQVDAGLAAVFRTYLIQLHEWRRACLERLSETFIEACDRSDGEAQGIAADIVHLQSMAGQSSGSGDEDARDAVS